jgi:hypothetical protein
MCHCHFTTRCRLTVGPASLPAMAAILLEPSAIHRCCMHMRTSTPGQGCAQLPAPALQWPMGDCQWASCNETASSQGRVCIEQSVHMVSVRLSQLYANYISPRVGHASLSSHIDVAVTRYITRPSLWSEGAQVRAAALVLA